MMMTSSYTDSQLDTEYDQLIMDMKQGIGRMQQKSDREKCAVWIQKLCEPMTSTSAKKNRNMYAHLLLSMLKRKSLDGPFISRPDMGPLPPLPSYMSVYMDANAFSNTFSESRIPDWVMAELPTETSENDSSRRLLDSLYFSSSYEPNNQRMQGDGITSSDFNFDGRPRGRTLEDRSQATNRSRHPSIPLSSANCYRQGSACLSRDMFTTDIPFSSLRDDVALTQAQINELEIRAKMIETRYQEECLKLQNQHDSNVKKILDRKNAEIDELKQRSRSKTQEQESAICLLEKKVTSLQQELNVACEQREQQLTNLQRQVEENTNAKQLLIEKKINDMALEHEQQKYELQKRHTAAIQELMEETNSKLNKMQLDYDQLMDSTSAVIKELEARIQQLSVETESISRVKQQLERRNADLDKQVEMLRIDVGEYQARLAAKDTEMQNVQDEHEEEMKSLKFKTDTNLEQLKDEHRLALSKSADCMHNLEQQVLELKQTLDTVQQQNHLQLKELEMSYESGKKQMEQMHQLKLEDLQHKLDVQEKQAAKKIKKLEMVVSHKEEEIHRLNVAQVEQNEQAQRVLDEFKVQIEKNSTRMYEDMKMQIEKVEAELSRSKSLREKQAREFESQKEELIRSHTKQLAEAKMKAELEQSRIQEDFHVQMELRRSEKDRELADLREALQGDLADMERRAKERMEKDAKLRVQLETQIQRLRDEVILVNQQRKQELMDLRVVRDQEKHTTESEFENQISKLKSQMEEQRFELEKRHSLEMEKLVESTNQRLKEIENDYNMRNTRAADTIADLQVIANKLKLELERQRQGFEQQLSVAESHYIDEKRQQKQQYLAHLAQVQRTIDGQNAAIQQLEKDLCQQQLDEEEKITQLRSNYEERLKGMMPSDVRQELEDTISSLQLQISFLQQRATVLQEDLNMRTMNPTAQMLLSAGTLPSTAAVQS